MKPTTHQPVVFPIFDQQMLNPVLQLANATQEKRKQWNQETPAYSLTTRTLPFNVRNHKRAGILPIRSHCIKVAASQP